MAFRGRCFARIDLSIFSLTIGWALRGEMMPPPTHFNHHSQPPLRILAEELLEVIASPDI